MTVNITVPSLFDLCNTDKTAIRGNVTKHMHSVIAVNRLKVTSSLPSILIFFSWHTMLNLEVKLTVKLSLRLTKHHAMKMYWGSGGIARRIL
jgi:hypothetical protein